MIDQFKRKTLKVVAAAGAVTASSGLLSPLIAGNLKGSSDPDMFSLESRHNAISNDLEIVVTNTGVQPVTITGISPGIIETARGEFDLAGLLVDGPLTIAPGASVSALLKKGVTDIFNDNRRLPLVSIRQALKERVRITTLDFASATIEVKSTTFFA